MKELVNYTTEILIALCVILFLWGVGYLITCDMQRELDDMQRELDFGTKCLAAGMQYVHGSCVK